MSVTSQDGQILLPGNAAAEEIRRRREENIDLEEQMRVLRSTQMNNSEVIGTLSNVATWIPSGETADPDPEGPPPETIEPEPETPPEPEPENPEEPGNE